MDPIVRERPQKGGERRVARARGAVQTVALADVAHASVTNAAGMILPAGEGVDGKAAFVVAVLDASEAVQYIGFSKDLRNTLRKLFCRRAERTHYYKAVGYDAVDQAAMLAQRQAWFDELGEPPAGNADPRQRALWEQPVDSGAVSERGALPAAKNRAAELEAAIRARGLTEPIEWNQELLRQGKCDVADAEALSEAEVGALRAQQEELESNMRSVEGVFARSGEPFSFPLLIESRFETNGGYMVDVVVTYEDTNTNHRLFLGKEYYEAVGATPDEMVCEIFKWLVAHKTPLHTDGTLEIDDFPVNYFSSSQVIQRWPDFAGVFEERSGGKQLPGFESFFHARTVEEYGNLSDPDANREFEIGPYAPYGKVGEKSWAGDGKDDLTEGERYYDPFDFEGQDEDAVLSPHAKLLHAKGRKSSVGDIEDQLAAF
eukprot:PRCOL_00006614-RA